MKSYIKKHWRDALIVVLALTCLVCLLNINSVKQERDILKKGLVTSTGKVLELQDLLAQYRIDYTPQEFESVEDFKYWVSHRDIPILEKPDLKRAAEIQQMALKEGYLISYQAALNQVTGLSEWWIMAKIGDEIWCFEPYTNQVTKYYPTPWWRD